MDLEVPDARYAKNGDVHLAYQVVGDGPVDIVVAPERVSTVEALWAFEGYAELRERLATIGRLILMDARGSGSSDPVPLGDPATFEHGVEDLLTVLDAAGSNRAFVMGDTSAVPLACVFAATHPDRTAGLVLSGGYASLIDRGDGVGIPPETREAAIDFFVSGYGDPEGIIRLSMPGEGRDEDRRREARIERMAMSPAEVRAHSEMSFDVDVRAALGAIQAPTLVLHASEDLFVPVGHAHYLAAHINGARLVERPGADHFWYLGDVEPTLAEITEFITGTRPDADPDRMLVTLLFTDIVGSTQRASEMGDQRWRELLDRHDATVRRQIERFRGREINRVGDGFVATFDGPARAVRCGCAIRDALRRLNLTVRAGIHTGEVERRGDDVGGIAVHVAQRISALAQPGEVLVSRTVVDLVAGSGIEFSDRGTVNLKGVPTPWQVFSVNR